MDSIVRRILQLSDPEIALSKKVSLSQNELIVNSYRFQFQKPLILAIGKASVKMANFFLSKLNKYESLVVKPRGDNLKLNGNAEVIESSHPYPDESSFEAGKKVREYLLNKEYDLVILLLSGGASSLVEDPIPPKHVYVDIMKKLITSGIGIEEVNVVRKHLSKIKGGRLASLSKSKIVTLVVSDVPGNDLSTVGSGPTHADLSTVHEAREIMRWLNLQGEEYLEETPKKLDNVWEFLILDVSEVLRGLNLENSYILSSEVRGEAKSFGAFLASLMNTQYIPFRRPFTLLFGGEPEVHLSGKVGKGGRNGEVCLSFLEWVRDEKFKLYAIATDGIDGNSDYAGCVVDGKTKLSKLEIRRSLEEHSSYQLLERTKSTVKTGPTGTNVNNIYVLIAP
ncbi:glycerate 2-kinase [Metallosphaera sp.]|uniref:glycerate 2-kinase n=1 Tax=Metallosphaera sp. TaxID=2020860 RepID=UPI003168C544